MRIISKNKDYYDHVMGIIGVDQSIIYIRDEDEFTVKENKVIKRSYAHMFDYIKYMTIGFCGKLYPFVITYDKHFLYNFDEFHDFMESNPKNKLDYYEKIKLKSAINGAKGHFEKPKTYMNQWFDEYKTPIFVFDQHSLTLTINSNLSRFEFYRVVDAWTAYQELSMYLGNILLPESKPIPKIDDVTMAECKGFDKWSFRKPKNNKKEPKK